MILINTTQDNILRYTANVELASEITSLVFTNEADNTVFTYTGASVDGSFYVATTILQVDLDLQNNHYYILQAFAGLKEVYLGKVFASEYDGNVEHLEDGFTQTSTDNNFITLD